MNQAERQSHGSERGLVAPATKRQSTKVGGVGLLLPISVILILAMLGSTLWWWLVTPKVVVTSPVRGPVVRAFYSTGTVEPFRDYSVRASVDGILRQLKVDKGTKVVAGEVLAVIEDPKLNFAVERAKAELAEKLARADAMTSPVLREYDARIRGTQELVDIAKREQKRMELMAEKQAASQTDLDRALDRTKTLMTELESLRQQRASRELELKREADVGRAVLSTAEAELDKSVVRAPSDGVVLDRPTGVGTRVAANDMLMTIADVSPENLVMRAQVDEEDVAGAVVGQEVKMTLYAFGRQVFSGRVDRIYERADTDRRTFEVDVKVEMQGKIFAAGMTGELAFILDKRADAMTLPAQAQQRGEIWCVRDGRLEKSSAVVGLTSVDVIEIQSGLSESDLVVVSAVPGGEGTRVRVTGMKKRLAAGVGSNVSTTAVGGR